DFSTLDITNTTALTLDGNQTIGNLIIGDMVPNTNWTFNAGTPNTSVLTLAVSSGTPVINVSNQIATFGAPFFGANGFIKTGSGTLRLNNSNTNSTGWLNGTVLVSNGVLQCGNATFGIYGNQNGTNRIIVTNGATLEVIAAIAVNNKNLTISGTG